MNHTPDSFHSLHVRLPAGLWAALQAQCQSSGESANHVITTALAEALDLDHHTLYQVSTSGALVQGVYQGCVRVADIRRHGDLGLGTFDGLDGEGLMLDGVCWQARGDGSVRVAPDESLAPFWAATRFQADQSHGLRAVGSWSDLMARIDALRPSANLFMAIRIRGRFDWIRVRTACKSPPGTDLATATSHQVEFEWEQLDGTLMGFWTPPYARTINVPGYHLHLLSDDHRHGGHVLNLRAERLELELQLDTQLQLALPETESFLKADLNGDPAAVLSQGLGGSE